MSCAGRHRLVWSSKGELNCCDLRPDSSMAGPGFSGLQDVHDCVNLIFSQEGDILGSFYNSISILRLNARVLYCSMKITRLRKEEGRERTFFCFHIASFPFGNLPNHPSILALSQPIAPPPSVLLVTSYPVSCNIKSTIHISTGRMV